MRDLVGPAALLVMLWAVVPRMAVMRAVGVVSGTGFRQYCRRYSVKRSERDHRDLARSISLLLLHLHHLKGFILLVFIFRGGGSDSGSKLHALPVLDQIRDIPSNKHLLLRSPKPTRWLILFRAISVSLPTTTSKSGSRLATQRKASSICVL